MFATTFEESLILKDRGLDINTADMIYPWQYNNQTKKFEYGTIIPKPEKIDTYDTHAWSLEALLNLLPIRVTSNNVEYVLDIYPTGIFSTHSATSKWIIEYKGYTFVEKNYRSQKTYMMLKSFQTDSLTDAAFNMVLWLIENGFLKTK